MSKQQINRPSAAFIASAWTALLLGAVAYLVGLFNAEMLLNEKGYYLTLLLFGLFSAVSLQKSVRDRLENIPVSSLYYSLCWFALLRAVVVAGGAVERDPAAEREGLLRHVVCPVAVWRCRRAEEYP